MTVEKLEKLLEDEGVPAVIIQSENETRENIVVVDQAKNLQYRFGMPGTALQEEEWKEILHVIDAMEDLDYLVCSGSLPPGVPEDIYAQLAVIARRKGARCIVDTPGRPLRLAITAGLYLIKPNIGELSAYAGRDYLSVEDAKAIAKEIVTSGHCEVVVVSMGADGAMLVTKDETEIFTSPKVDRKSTVGAGDSMVAGIVYSLSNNKSLHESVRYGVACGTAATMNPGTELCRKEDAAALFTRPWAE